MQPKPSQSMLSFPVVARSALVAVTLVKGDKFGEIIVTEEDDESQ
jgi:hypothetical protein